MALISGPKRQVDPYTKNNHGDSDWSQNMLHTHTYKVNNLLTIVENRITGKQGKGNKQRLNWQ